LRTLPAQVRLVTMPSLAYYTFPEEHWRRIRTNKSAGTHRCARSDGASVLSARSRNGQSAVDLAAAELRHIAGTPWSTKRYLNIELLKEQNMRGAIIA
jgi:putative transposase